MNTLRSRVPRSSAASLPPRELPRRHGLHWFSMPVLTAFLASVTGCHHQQQVADVPPPPPVRSALSVPVSPARASIAKPAPVPVWEPTPAGDLEAEAAAAPEGFFDDFHGRPILTETGTASWYGPNYHQHHAADGTVYDQNGMTAAHRTLPLGSTVRVTNLQTGEQVLVRITDRGPFAPGRVLDLSLGAAKTIGLYRQGIAKVRVEAFPHTTANPAGRWCVQTGAFKEQTDALDLKAALVERYKSARVIEFAGPTGFWVRIDPATRGKVQAEEILAWIGNPDPAALPYLVRTD